MASEEGIGRGPVVVADDVVLAGWDEAPMSIGWRNETVERVVVAPQELGGSDERRLIFEHPLRARVRPSGVHLAVKERLDRPPLLVEPKRLRGSTETDAL